MKNGFFRGHGLGNDYVVMDPTELTFKLTPGKIRGICDRHWGLGSDGILALVPSKKADFGLRIYNPDGSEAEKSGNGLRIFARYLHATGKTKKRTFTVETKGGLVSIALHLDRHGDAAAGDGGLITARSTFATGTSFTAMFDSLVFRQLFDAASSTYTYVLGDPISRQAVIIDTVFERHLRDRALLAELGLNLVAAIDTHCHADHVTGAWLMRQATGCST